MNDPTKPRPVALPPTNADHYAPFDQAMSRWINQRYPLQENVTSREGGVPDVTGTLPSLATSILTDIFSRKRTTSAAGGPAIPGAPTIDVTDPSYDPGTTALSLADSRLRAIRRMMASLKATSTGLLTSQGVRQAILRGEMAPPRSREEEIVDAIAPMIGQIGLFAATSGAAAGVRAGGAELAGRLAPGLAGVEGIGATGAAAAVSPVLTGLAAATGGRVTGTVLGRAAMNVAGDVVAGLGLAGAEIKASHMMGQPVSNEEATNLLRSYALWSAGAGVLMRTGTILRTGWGLGKLTGIFNTAFDAEVGVEVANKIAVKVGPFGHVQWRYKPGTTIEIDGKMVDVSNRYATPPRVEESAQATAALVGKMRQELSESPEGRALSRQVTDATAAPPDMQQRESEINIRSAIYFQDQLPGQVAKLRREGSESLIGAEHETLSQQVYDPTLSDDTRMAAAAKLRAWEYALGVSRGTPAGVLPFEHEVAALELVRQNWAHGGSKRIAMIADQLGARGRQALAARVRQIANEYPRLEKISEGFAESLAMTDATQKSLSRGFATGSQAVTKDGKIVELATDPHFGKALARDMGDPHAKPLGVNIAELTPIPKAGRYVVLNDGRMMRARHIDAVAGTFTGHDMVTTKDVPNIKFSEIKEVSGSPSHWKEHEYHQANVLRGMGHGATPEHPNVPEMAAQTAEIPPVEAGTPTGEPVVVTGVNEQLAKITTKDGKTTTIPRKSLRRTTRNKPAPSPVEMAGEVVGTTIEAPAVSMAQRLRNIEGAVGGAAGEITGTPVIHGVGGIDYTPPRQVVPATGPVARQMVDFAPGTIPDALPQPHKILFMRVPIDKAAGFKVAYESGQDIAPYIGAGVHVLPSAYDSGYQLYAVELPWGDAPPKAYSKSAKNAVQALGNKVVTRVGSYDTPINLSAETIGKARIYPVPAGLQLAAVSSEREMRGMPQAEHKAYLRNLIVLHARESSPIAQAAVDVSDATATLHASIDAGTPTEVTRSETALSDAHAELLTQVLEGQIAKDNIGPSIDEAIRRAAHPKRVQARSQFMEQGLTPETLPEWLQTIRDIQETPIGYAPFEELTLKSSIEPGQMLYVAKRLQPEIATTRAPDALGALGIMKGADVAPTTSTFYEAVPYVDGRSIRSGIKRFQTAEELAQYIEDQKYIPSATKTFPTQYATKNGERNARIVPTHRSDFPYEIQEEEGIENIRNVSAEQRVAGVAGPAKPLTSDQKLILIQMGQPIHDVASGATFYLEHPVVAVRDLAAAKAWMRENHMTPMVNAAGEDIPTRFSQLPRLSAIAGNAQAMRETGGTLGEILLDSIRMHSKIPIAVEDYAVEFSDMFYEATGGEQAFGKEMRRILQIPEAGDFGPSLSHSVLSASDILDSEGAVKWGWTVEGNPIRPVGHDWQFKPKIHISAVAPDIVPKDTKVFYRRLTGVEKVSTGELDRARAIAKSQDSQTAWTQSFAKAQTAISPETARLSQLNLARYEPTGQVVEVMNPRLGEPDVVVRFPGEDQTLSVSKELVTPASELKGSEAIRDVRHYRQAEATVEGRDAFYMHGEPEFGFGKVERSMGLLGARDRVVVASAFRERTLELGRHLRLNRAGAVVGDANAIDELIDIYKRSQWLSPYEIQYERVEGALRPTPEPVQLHMEKEGGIFAETRQIVGIRAVEHPLSVERAVSDAIREIDPKLETPFRMAVYMRTKQNLGDSPWAKLFAEAQSGLITEGQAQVLRAWAKDAGLSPALPPVKLVAELLERRLYNPQAAQIAVELNHVIGIGLSLDRADIHEGDVILKHRNKTQDIGFGQLLGIPWKLPRRHPLSRLVDDMLLDAVEQESRSINSGTEFWQGLQDMGYNNPDILEIRNALDVHDTWDAAAKAGVPERYQQGFTAFKKEFEDGLERVIRYDLMRRIEPHTYDGSMLDRRTLLKAGFEAEEMKTMTLLGHIDPTLKPNGEVMRGLTADQIEKFIQMRRQYASSADIPIAEFADFDKSMSWERFSRLFDFWKNYGIKNYWPIIHEGNMAITVEIGGVSELKGWAQNLLDAHEIIEQLAERGVLHFDKNNKLLENVSINSRTPVMDDILMRATNADGREWQRITREFAKHVDMDADQVRALFIALPEREVSYVRQPFLVHAQTRTANLKRILIDPRHEFNVWNARLARMEYRFQAREAYRTLQNEKLDRALSNMNGNTPTLNRLAGEGGLPKLKLYMEDKIARALGEQGRIERGMEDIVTFAHMVKNATPMMLKKLAGGEMPFTIDDLWTRKNWETRYGGRDLASRMVGLQSKIRLGGSLSSGIANATQYWVTTLPRLMQHMNPVDAGLLATQSWAEVWNIFRLQVTPKAWAKVSPKMHALASIVEEVPGVSVMPSKAEAGAGGSAWAASKGIPSSLGKTTMQHAVETASWFGMLPFNAAESVNRYATALSAYRIGRNIKGLTHGEAIQFAGDMVRETQFAYDELAIPKLMASFGPFGRVLFQFRPFMINMLSYEKDLVMSLAHGEPGAGSALIAHGGMMLALGGTVGVMQHPVIEGVVAGLNALGIHTPLDADQQTAQNRRQRRVVMSGEEQYANSNHAMAKDIIHYGIPGWLTGLSIGQRVGVSGQDISSTFSMPNLLGPSFSIYSDAIVAAAKYAFGAGESGRGVAGGLAGGLVIPEILQAVPGRVGDFSKAFFSQPYSHFITGWAASILASAGSMDPVADFLFSTKEGRTLLTRDMPTMIRNWERSAQLALTGSMRTISGAPLYVPLSNSADEVAHWLFGPEADITKLTSDAPAIKRVGNWAFRTLVGTAAALANPETRDLMAGLPSIRGEEYSAAVSLVNSRTRDVTDQRKFYLDRISQAWVDNDQDKVFKYILDAERKGIMIHDSDITRAVQAHTVESLQQRERKAPAAARGPEGE